MITSEFSLAGLTAEGLQHSSSRYPLQGGDIWTMAAEDFFEQLEKSNAKCPLPEDFEVKPIEYNEERKCRMVHLN